MGSKRVLCGMSVVASLLMTIATVGWTQTTPGMGDLNRCEGEATLLGQSNDNPLDCLTDLPKGVKITDGSFEKDPDDERVALLEAKVTIEAGTRIEDLIDALGKTKLLPTKSDLSGRIVKLYDSLDRERIVLWVRLRLVEGLPAQLHGSHLCVGALEPVRPNEPGHTVEIEGACFRKLLQSNLEALMAHYGVVGKRFDFQYDLPLNLAFFKRNLKRRGFGLVSRLSPRWSAEGIRVEAGAEGWVEGPFRDKGVRIRSERTAGTLVLKSLAKHPTSMEVSARFEGDLQFDAAAGPFEGWVTTVAAKAADKFFRSFTGKMEAMLKEKLSHRLAIEEGGLKITNTKITTTSIGFSLAPVRVDLAKTVALLLGRELPATITSIRLSGDRFVVKLTGGIDITTGGASSRAD